MPDVLIVFFMVLSAVFAVGCLFALVCLCLILFVRGTPAAHQATVIVLGCHILDDKPTRMLHSRLVVTAEYLLKNPQALCIVSGFQAKNEQYTEAFIMKRELVKTGVEAHRITTEDESSSTSRNLSCCAEIIKKQGLSKEIVIATSEFHQFRGQYFARKNGLIPFALPSKTSFPSIVYHGLREVLAVGKAFILKY